MFRLLIIPYLIIEVFTSYYFVSANGFAAYAVEIVISAILGGYVVANRSWMGFFNLMKISPREILSGVGFVAGGILLIAPGIFGDILGVCVITASFYCVTSDMPKFSSDSENAEKSQQKFWRRKAHDGDVIDVEIVEENEIEIQKSIGERK